MKSLPSLQPEQKIKYASLVIRIGLALVFLYAAVSALMKPDAWLGYIPSAISSHVSAKLVLDGMSIVQIILAIWLAWGKFARYAGALAILLLGGILVSNLGTLLITFRDVGLICAAAAVIILDC